MTFVLLSVFKSAQQSDPEIYLLIGCHHLMILQEFRVGGVAMVVSCSKPCTTQALYQ